MLKSCAICEHLQEGDSGATSLVGLITSFECILGPAQTRLKDGIRAPSHVMAPVCAEHVVAIYRGRVSGVAMAWRVATMA